jgi:(p)ppGpp synthase/HD superfamily hydrolase
VKCGEDLQSLPSEDSAKEYAEETYPGVQITYDTRHEGGPVGAWSDKVMVDIDLNAASAFAVAAHAAVGQKCKATGEPYSKHPERVVAILRNAGFDQDEHRPMLAAAWSHDVLEDTQVTKDVIEALFGVEVARLVVGLTNAFTHAARPDLNRAARKKLEHERLAAEDWMIQTIKCADIIDNAARLASYPDKAFAQSYVKELAALVSVLTRADAGLHALARRTVAEAQVALAI